MRMRKIKGIAGSLIVIGLVACTSSTTTGSSGTSGSNTSGDGTGTATSSATRKLDCGAHGSIGSCGPISDDCYCAGFTCHKYGTGSYECIYPCTSDAECDFIAAGNRYGTCYPFSGGSGGHCGPPADTSKADAGGSLATTDAGSGSSGGGSSSGGGGGGGGGG